MLPWWLNAWAFQLEYKTRGMLRSEHQKTTFLKMFVHNINQFEGGDSILKFTSFLQQNKHVLDFELEAMMRANQDRTIIEMTFNNLNLTLSTIYPVRRQQSILQQHQRLKELQTGCVAKRSQRGRMENALYIYVLSMCLIVPSGFPCGQWTSTVNSMPYPPFFNYSINYVWLISHGNCKYCSSYRKLTWERMQMLISSITTLREYCFNNKKLDTPNSLLLDKLSLTSPNLLLLL